MGRNSGISVSGYHPKIWTMHWVMSQREALREKQEWVLNRKKMRAMYWQQRMRIAVDVLRSVDQKGWERWYDDDANVTEFAPNKDITLLVEKRVEELTGKAYQLPKCRNYLDIYYWEDEKGAFIFSKEVGKPTFYWLDQFKTAEEARAFIGGLPGNNHGYGIVLDILPAGVLSE